LMNNYNGLIIQDILKSQPVLIKSEHYCSFLCTYCFHYVMCMSRYQTKPVQYMHNNHKRNCYGRFRLMLSEKDVDIRLEHFQNTINALVFENDSLKRIIDSILSRVSNK